MNVDKIIKLFTAGKVGLLPTDTIYGLVGSALNKDTVERIYKLRKRTPSKPLIILISSIQDLDKFGVKITAKEKTFLQKIWPNPISVILSCPSERFEYLSRGTKTLAFRIPKNDFLLNILKQTGPLVAPSANLEGERPADTILQAKKYFKNQIDFYFNAGKLTSLPSTLIQLKNGHIKTLRQGAFNVSKLYIPRKVVSFNL